MRTYLFVALYTPTILVANNNGGEQGPGDVLFVRPWFRDVPKIDTCDGNQSHLNTTDLQRAPDTSKGC